MGEEPVKSATQIGYDMRRALFDIADKEASALWVKVGVIEAMNAMIEGAIMAEREACARVADNFTTSDILPFGNALENECAQVGQEYAADMLADAIRNRAE